MMCITKRKSATATFIKHSTSIISVTAMYHCIALFFGAVL